MRTYDADSVLQGELLNDEHIIWSGQPRRTLFACADVVLVPFGLWWSGFAFSVFGVIVLATLRGHPEALVAAIIAGPLAAVGVYFVLGRFFVRRWIKDRTYYALTTKRVLVLTRALGEHLYGAPIGRIFPVRESRRDGAGTLWFGKTSWWERAAGSTLMDFPIGTTPLAFFDIDQVDLVYAMVNERLGPLHGTEG